MKLVKCTGTCGVEGHVLGSKAAAECDGPISPAGAEIIEGPRPVAKKKASEAEKRAAAEAKYEAELARKREQMVANVAALEAEGVAAATKASRKLVAELRKLGKALAADINDTAADRRAEAIYWELKELGLSPRDAHLAVRSLTTPRESSKAKSAA